jgi:hypothetical protein
MLLCDYARSGGAPRLATARSAGRSLGLLGRSLKVATQHPHPDSLSRLETAREIGTWNPPRALEGEDAQPAVAPRVRQCVWGRGGVSALGGVSRSKRLADMEP